MALRSILPRKPTDLIALTILLTAGFQGQSLSLVLIVSMTLLLASYAQTILTEPEQLALYSYGVTKKQLALVHYVKGLLIATIGTLPFYLPALMSSYRSPSIWTILLPTLVISGIFYLLPFAFRLRSTQFVGLLKN